MTAILREIKTDRDEYAESCIRRLEAELERAREIPLKAIVITTVDFDDNFRIQYTAMSRAELMGRIMFQAVEVGKEK